MRVSISLASVLGLAPQLALADVPPLSLHDAQAIAKAAVQARSEGLAGVGAGPALAAIASPDPSVRAAADASLSSLAVAVAAAEHGMSHG